MPDLRNNFEQKENEYKTLMEFWINVSKNDINSILLFNLKKMKDSKFIEIFKDPEDETFFLYDLIIIKTSIYLSILIFN